MSSRYIVTKDNPCKVVSIRRWNELGAFVKPKGILQNSYSLIPGPGQNAVFSLSAAVNTHCAN